MKRKIVIYGAIFLWLLTMLQPQVSYAQSWKYNDDFLKAAGKNDFGEMERLLTKRKGQIELADCMVQILANRVNGFSPNNTMRAMQLLVQNGCDVNGFSMIPIGGGSFSLKTPLSAAIEYDHQFEVVQFLINSGAYRIMDDNIRYAIAGNQGYLSQAIKNKNVRELLLAKGSDINTRIGRNGGVTMLMWESRNGNFDAVRFLVENGARVNLRADDGSTAASLAYDKGEIEIYNYLKANGAIDFEPKQVTQQPQQQTAPQSPTTNVYVQPSAPAQPVAPQAQAPTGFQFSALYGAQNIDGVFTSDAGGWCVLWGNGSNGSVQFTDVNKKLSSGTCTISGNNMTWKFNSGPLSGKSFSYTIENRNKFYNRGESFTK